MESLKALAQNLDHELTSVGGSIETLTDAEILLGPLVHSMEEAVYRGEEKDYYREHHRTVRVLWHLVRHTMHELSEEYESVYRIKGEIFNEVMKNKKSPVAGNDETFA